MFGFGIGLFACFVLTILGEIQSRQLNKVFDDYLGVYVVSLLIGFFCQVGLSATIKRVVKK